MAMRMAAVAVAVAVAFVAVMGVLASPAAAQTPSTPDCASKLVPCAPYINTTGTPPEACCGPIKDAVQNDLKCLCGLYETPEIFKAFNINITQALGVSKRCGLADTTEACKGNLPSFRFTAPKQMPFSYSVSSSLVLLVVAGSPSGGGKNSGHRTLSFGLPGLMSLLLALWSVLA
ncbi:hypothetical protein HU200_043096 [Digitaria exilis]|uniref:Bifunctional inhibitor/plant lipid transfer protein/seed storage helical domain-containing protein n=1 Tax=Digitaria exilis TaxID=1010633 RepID=A0A835B454_9POAL|nr:hypothetical protein HU200_043096 [Digitaria exilis]